MGLLSARGAMDARLRSVLIGGTAADLKNVGKAQKTILGVLEPRERLIFVVADTHSGFVWAFTDQRLLETQGRFISYGLPVSKIAEATVRYAPAKDGDVQYFCEVSWRGGPLRSESSGRVNSNGFLLLERINGEDEVRRITALIDARLAEAAAAPQAPNSAADGPQNIADTAVDGD